ncbi:MAG: folylpolyglutamate synthase/dihydrofolate synthase family protein [Bacteroidales bacterium]|nr:folylpolyglutamate synthase/dihydrofolate synthase family protein [Bacteroidales bacterium]
MNYRETIQYLYDCVPMFQNVGAQGYKEGLANTLTLDEHLGHPHRSYRTIHVAGTNGKGSCSHTIAAILQSAGYKVGLYTSPHLVDFRERIRVNGQMISEDYVVRFVAEQRPFFEPLQPSFFEVTTAMAFKYFEEQRVDIAVIEVGLGGRLDCTNIITPILSVITNISFDHTQFLGHTLAAIAAEKAGIIKAGVPVIIGETNAETKPVFLAKAEEVNAPIVFAEDSSEILSFEQDFAHATLLYTTRTMSELRGELCGYCQEKNTNTVLHALAALRQAGLHFEEPDVRRGFAHVCELTGLMGRWQRLSTYPTVICDTGHNEGGFAYIVRQLEAQQCHTMRIVFGMVSDKDVTTILAMLPKDAVYYFTQASVKRALSADDMRQKAALCGLSGHSYPTVSEAYNAALNDAETDDFVYVGGSSYVVADLLRFLFFKDK